MTKQEYYDLLVQSAQDGTFPSINDKHECAYRVPGTKKRCAIGLLIPDNKYISAMENKNCLGGEVYAAFKPVEGLIKIQDYLNNDYLRIQRCHDQTACETKKEGFAQIFIEKLNNLDCFRDVKKYEVVQEVNS